MKIRTKLTMIAAAMVAVLAALAWPGVEWLRCAGMAATPDNPADIVYLVAGSKDQLRRVAALEKYVKSLRPGSERKMEILVGNDTEPGPWHGPSQRNLSMAKWAEWRLRERLGREWNIRVVPGHMFGTDGEMRILGAFLRGRPQVRKIALVSSPTHLRRAVERLKASLPRQMEIEVIEADMTLMDRCPLLAANELAKLARDRAGLARSPVLSRNPANAFYMGGVVLALIAAIAYTWILYPAIVLRMGRRRGRKTATGPYTPAGVTVFLSAHNEEDVIRKRLENLVGGWGERVSGYRSNGVTEHRDVGVWERGVKIVVGLDGCTDRTAAIARDVAADHPEIVVCDFPVRRGKAAVLKEIVSRKLETGGPSGHEVSPSVDGHYMHRRRPDGRGLEERVTGARCQVSGECGEKRPEDGDDILVFTDANTEFNDDALERLLRPFADPEIGGVCGRLEIAGGGAAHTHETSYWNMETAMKEAESNVDSCLGANGAIYAVRRGLFWRDLPDNTVVDDFVIGMKVREQGKRMVFVGDAVAWETAPEARDEWRRRVRIGAGDFQALWLCRKCLGASYGSFAWMFWSHKVLRWFCPHMVVLVAAASGAALSPNYVGTGGTAVWPVLTARWALAGLGVFALAALAGLAMPPVKWRPARLLSLSWRFAVMNAALAAGFVKFCGGGLKGHWERTGRKGRDHRSVRARSVSVGGRTLHAPTETWRPWTEDQKKE